MLRSILSAHMRPVYFVTAIICAIYSGAVMAHTGDFSTNWFDIGVFVAMVLAAISGD